MTEHAYTLPSTMLTNPDIRKRIMDQQIKACLDAMVENRRFTYTDIFLHGNSTLHHANALFVKVMRP